MRRLLIPCLGSVGLVVACACGGDEEMREPTLPDEAPPTRTAGDESANDTPPEPEVEPEPEPLPVCSADTALSLGQCVEGDRYQTDLELIAQPRVPGSPHHQVVQDLCADRLAELGFVVERHAYGSGVNVIGVRAGTTEPDRRVLIGAHYDHIEGCDGADDNATGTAATLESARVLATRDFPRTLVVACWDEEERGLLGSRAYADRARSARDDIVVYYNYEMIGFVDPTPGAQRTVQGLEIVFPDAARALEARERRADFLAVAADEAAAEHVARVVRYGERVGLPVIPLVVPTPLLGEPLLRDLRRSDHSPFWDRGYPALTLSDTSEFRYDGYHCRTAPDTVDRLNQAFSTRVIQATVAAIAESLGLP